MAQRRQKVEQYKIVKAYLYLRSMSLILLLTIWKNCRSIKLIICKNKMCTLVKTETLLHFDLFQPETLTQSNVTFGLASLAGWACS